MDKKILDVHVEEKDGAFVIRVSGEKASQVVEMVTAMCGCGCRPHAHEGKAAAHHHCC